MLRGLIALAPICAVQGGDPAPGWMAYAEGTIPSGKERITRLEMTWTVGADATPSQAFYAPWFGMDPTDNNNLLQPVNPWMGRAWSMYTEYFQFMPPWNHNSKSFPVKAGQTLHGSIVYDAATDSYNQSNMIVETGETSSHVVKCQNGKKFMRPWVVYEKLTKCVNYPPDGIVTFRDIVVECDGKDCARDVQWEEKVMDENCNMQAHVDKNANTISITWDINAPSKYDNYTDEELFILNYHGWATRLPLPPTTPVEHAAWQKFKLQYRREYPTVEEEDKRFIIFVGNLRRTERLSNDEPHADFGVTKFSDMTTEEFRALLGYRSSQSPNEVPTAPKVQVHGALPDSVDWTHRATTPVKDQGNCGSCWAFSATEQIESDLKLQRNVSVVLAPQELVDCTAKGWPRLGCLGGEPAQAYKVIETLGGMELEKDYPYRGWLEIPTCHFKKDKAAATIVGWASVGRNDEAEMKKYVGTTGPLSVCVNAGSWHSYRSGVMSNCPGGSTDHCVQVVGYGKSPSGVDYWKIRNSWGTDFGEEGFLRVALGSNQCAITSEPTKTTAGSVIDARKRVHDDVVQVSSIVV